MADAFYLSTRDPARFLATAHTAAVWDAATQHAGPPAALLVRTIERTSSTLDGPATLARLTVEILGPVPVAEVRVEARVARPGRSVELVEAQLAAGGRPVLAARAWRIRSAAVGLPPGLAVEQAPPARTAAAADFADPALRSGYLRAMEWRFVQGGLEAEGPAAVWARQRIPLVDGEPPTPTQRLVTLADSGNGLSRMLPFDAWWFINTELTVHLFRPPTGEWMYVAAHTLLGPSGLGLAETEMYDDDGRVGRGAQALLVGRRP